MKCSRLLHCLKNSSHFTSGNPHSIQCCCQAVQGWKILILWFEISGYVTEVFINDLEITDLFTNCYILTIQNSSLCRIWGKCTWLHDSG